uniref:Uncharacterized protein n=1 Tax=Salmonella enterica subsp. enterica serovar Heidelberg TaxID=611 RepID=H9TK83_SALET|nr:hypothetical protein pSH696_135_127 [Salmonella enterica subsp. enterica serovar Heidelberg]
MELHMNPFKGRHFQRDTRAKTGSETDADPNACDSSLSD